ncbi:alpha/beta hydrolase [Nodosilinea sp. LEGE 07088]|uniref:alpha/beta fold hydrolase n=1 Tax=Nodosilinea sp. LEGE 07088 TaxID=2777968 RepID=UPI00187DEF12|nr:alpha/beta hydrolase [Nodosilinea sp. LEGE 07088]MBE9135962.1 alpha/beta hydrolase [Nodosilinea sp. LEGE 07088]
MAYLEINQVNHYYEWIGTETPRDSAATRPVMVFIHGWAGSARYWQSTAMALSDRYDCLLYDMRGFGRSTIAPEQQDEMAARGYELDTYADDLAALLDALNLPQVSINAHSMGASVAVYFLNQYRERCDRAILTCNGIFEYDKAAFETFYRFGGYVVKLRPKWLGQIPLAPRFFMARFLKRPIPAAEKAAFLEDFLNADYATALGTIFTSVSKQATEVMPVEFAKIAVPTLLVSGEFDQITPAELGRAAADLNPKIEYALVKNTGHFPMLEDPDTYLGYVNKFLG